MSQHQCEILLAALDRGPSIVDRLRQGLLERPGRFPPIEEMARTLCLSPRSLRRQLREEGHSYSGVITALRYELAREYLEVTPLSIQQIAGVLGYSEAGNFSHAFKRWSGVSPNAYRRRHQPAAAPPPAGGTMDSTVGQRQPATR